MIIDGVSILEGSMFDVFNPFNGEVVGSVADATDTNITSALQKSFNYHCDLSAEERSSILIKTADYLEENKHDLSKLITLESGLSLKDTLYEVERVVSCAR